MWWHCFCLFAAVSYLTIIFLIGFTAVLKNTSKLPWSSSNSTPLEVPSGSSFKKHCWSERGKPNPPNQTMGQEERTETNDIFLPEAITLKKTPSPNHRTSTTSCHDGNLLPLRNSNALKTSVGSGLIIAVLGWFLRQVPCPVHPFLASNSLILLQVLMHFQGTDFIPLQTGKQVYHSFFRVIVQLS